MIKPKTSFALDDTDKPKYQRMVERLEEGVSAGQWKVGDRLPSNRELAVLFGVTIGTVSKAMSEAVRRGIVDTRVGSGTYIREQRTRESGEAIASVRLTDLALNVLPVAPVQDLLANALTAYARSQSQGVARLFAHVDVPPRGRFERSAANWLTSMGTPAEPSEVVLTNGVHHALIAAFQVLLQPGDLAVCDALSYTGFQRIARMRGVRLVGVAGDKDGMLPDALEKALREGARVVVANPVLQNPTATTMSPERRARIATLCRKADVRVIEDGVGAPLADPGTSSLSAHIPERTLHVTGYSKTIASGFRLGYARVPAPWVETFRQAVVALQWFPPGYFAELLEVMNAEGVTARCIQAHREEAAARQHLLREFLPQVAAGVTGYHAWLPLEGERSSMELCDQMLAEGVKLSAAQHFSVGADAPDGVRISLGACDSRQELRRALSALANALRSNARYRAAAAAPAV
jgi:DNA-binding transcriptional MocR family regulator